MTNGHDWSPFEKGHTIGMRGSEGGIILVDEEHRDGARITLERNGFTPFAITCGIYGWMVHTCFFSGQEEAQDAFHQMKRALEAIMQRIPDRDDPQVDTKSSLVTEAIKKFIELFP